MRYLVVLTALAVAAVGCGSSSGSASSSEGQAYVGALMKSYDFDGGDRGFTRTQAKCVAEGMVDSVGTDKLKEVGVMPKDLAKGDGNNPFTTIGKSLSRTEAEGLVTVLTDGTCFNFTDLVIDQAAKGSSDTFAGIEPKKVRCLFDELLANKAFKNAMVDSILGRKDSSAAFANALGDRSEIFSIMGKCKLRPNEISS